MSIDNTNGHIVAMVGGQNYGNDTEAGQSSVNLATSVRQPGSSFKAIVLLAALNEGMSPSVRINCMATLQVTPTWAPSNIDYHNYGICTLQRATALSSNTGYVQVAEAIGMDKVIEMAQKVGIDSTINEGLASSLGSSEVSPLDMCEAYSVIASGGVHRNPVAITKIEDRNGNIVYEHTDEPEQIVDSAVAQDATEVLQTVITQGTATSMGAYFHADQPLAGKTGTSDNYADLWFVGFSPQLTTAVWTGCPDYGQKRVYFQGGTGSTANLPIPIWGTYMNSVLSGTERQEFPTADHEAEYQANSSWTFVGTNSDPSYYDEDKDEVLPLVKRFYRLGYNIAATFGTAEKLKAHGIRVRVLGKLSEGSDEILQTIRRGEASYILNTRAINSGIHYKDGYAIRRCAVENNVTMFTSLDTVRMLLGTLEEISFSVSTIDEQ